MIKEEILAMEAGRELSGLVAVEVMGRNCAHVNLAPLNPNSIQHSNGAKSRCLDCGYKDYNSSFRGSFLYCSTNILDAWQVVEKLSAMFPQFIVEVWTSREYFEPDHRNRCLIWGTGKIEVTAKTAPEAICKTALLAKLAAE